MVLQSTRRSKAVMVRTDLRRLYATMVLLSTSCTCCGRAEAPPLAVYRLIANQTRRRLFLIMAGNIACIFLHEKEEHDGDEGGDDNNDSDVAGDDDGDGNGR